MNYRSPALRTPWTDVTNTKGELAKAVGTIEWKKDGVERSAKGKLSLQRKTFPTGMSAWGGVTYRICIDGTKADNPLESVMTAIELPPSVGWGVTSTSKVKSKNSKARVVTIVLPTNEEKLVNIIATIPFAGSGENEKILGNAVVFADIQSRAAAAANTPQTPAEDKKCPPVAAKLTPKQPSYSTAAVAAASPKLTAAKSNKKKAPTPRKLAAKTPIKGKKTTKKRKLIPTRGNVDAYYD